jgi:threonylcarbamoyladenosine tRNA methylthiotransferase MtaB
VFPFSPRPGTPAAKMPQVASAAIKARAARLRATGQAAAEQFLRTEIGSTRDVLVERDGFGRTPQHAGVSFEGAARPGSTIRLDIVGARDGELLGRVAERAAA